MAACRGSTLIIKTLESVGQISSWASLLPNSERKLTTAVDRMPAFPRSVQKVRNSRRHQLPAQGSGRCHRQGSGDDHENTQGYQLGLLQPAQQDHLGDQSVVYLGINTIKNLALSFAAVGMLPRVNTAGFDIQRYLVHLLLATANVARLLCSTYARGEADSGDCYVAGLSHDFGKVVFAQFMAAEFRQALLRGVTDGVPLYQAERDLIGVDHGVVGAMLAKKWQFPNSLVECIRDHHVENAVPSAMLDCLRVADQVVAAPGLRLEGCWRHVPAGRGRYRRRFASGLTT